MAASSSPAICACRGLHKYIPLVFELLWHTSLFVFNIIPFGTCRLESSIQSVFACLASLFLVYDEAALVLYAITAIHASPTGHRMFLLRALTFCLVLLAMILFILASVTVPVDDNLHFLKVERQVEVDVLGIFEGSASAELKVGAYGYCFDTSETSLDCSSSNVGWTIGGQLQSYRASLSRPLTKRWCR